MAELVQATPEELDAFSKKCTARGQESETLVSKAISEVEGVRAKWGGQFAKAFGAEWGKWQQDMKQFPKEVDKTAAEMTRLAAIYRKADQEAAAATKSVPGVGGGP
jgi:WXG100 family type VII secretion target